MDARDEILGRIAQASVGPIAADRTKISTRPADLDAFCERVADYRAVVHRATSSQLRGLLAAVVEGERVVLPAGINFGELAGEIDAGLTHAELANFDIVVTGCAIAIEESGTIVLDGSPGQGRRAITLIPDHHVCIVRAEQVVATIEEALARLNPQAPLTFISGPSATSDIELVRVEGVHGPRTLEVILLE